MNNKIKRYLVLTNLTIQLTQILLHRFLLLLQLLDFSLNFPGKYIGKTSLKISEKKQLKIPKFYSLIPSYAKLICCLFLGSIMISGKKKICCSFFFRLHGNKATNRIGTQNYLIEPAASCLKNC